MSMKRIQCFSWFARHPGDVWASELHSSASNATGEMGEIKLEKMRWMSEIMQPILWNKCIHTVLHTYRMVSNGISKMKLHCTTEYRIALYKYGIVCIFYCVLHDTANSVSTIYMVLYCIVLYWIVLLYITNALNHDQSFSLICPNEQSIRTNYTKSVKFHPKPGFRAPFKRGKNLRIHPRNQVLEQLFGCHWCLTEKIQ